MPPGRQVACGPPVLAHDAPGRYTVTVSNGAPFPAVPRDSGYQVYVQTVGGAANCFDTGLSSDAAFTLTSNIRCVTPDGSDVDADFSWYYRADSFEYPQYTGHGPNHGYATANGDGTIRDDESFNAIGPGSVTSSRSDQGLYTVTFQYMNPRDGGYVPDPKFNLNNVLVSKTCVDDDTASCARAVCIPYSWNLGTETERDTSVEVRCYDRGGNPAGQARDTNFRLFVGEQAHTSQTMPPGNPHEFLDEWFAWVNWDGNNTANVCYDDRYFLHRNQHETPAANPYTEPLSICKTATGSYDVKMHTLFYTADEMIPIVSSRGAGGAYCNVEDVCWGFSDGQNCAGNEPRITVKCYNRDGSPADVSFNMSSAYPQWD
ncbi:MAG TPA: hypothetical protein VK550_26175 [Polyangiaceae bacterium]|nr:hypothetical protein [Polyangiaceae bacterium]